MSRKTYKTIETPSGSGEIRKAGAHLAKVFYHLQVRQETIVGELAAGQEDRPGRLDIAGEVTVSQDEPMQAQVLKGMNSGDLFTNITFNASAWANFPDIQSLHCKTRRWDGTLRVAR